MLLKLVFTMMKDLEVMLTFVLSRELKPPFTEILEAITIKFTQSQEVINSIKIELKFSKNINMLS
jgi:hypothetical protein